MQGACERAWYHAVHALPTWVLLRVPLDQEALLIRGLQGAIGALAKATGCVNVVQSHSYITQ